MTSVEEALIDFLGMYPSHCEYDEVWPLQIPVPLHGRLGFAGALPPVEVRSSILGIVTDADSRVLFIHPDHPSGNISHLIPGGRPNPGETSEQTLIREVGEETGWRVTPHSILGFRYFHHLGPLTPEMADRPYPDFVQAIYAAVAETYDPELLLPGEAPCRLVEAEWAEAVTSPSHRPLLAAALSVTQKIRN